MSDRSFFGQARRALGNNPNLGSYISLLLGQLMVGCNIVASRVLSLDHPPLQILIGRFLVASIVLLLLHGMTPKVKKHAIDFKSLSFRDWLFLTAQALCAGALFNLFLLLGLKYTTASVAGIITSALPAYIAVLSWIILREHISVRKGLCILFAVFGLIVMNLSKFMAVSDHHFIGDFFLLLALLPEALYYVLIKCYRPTFPLFFAAALLNAINLPFLLLFFFFFYDAQWIFSMTDVGLVVITGVASAFFYVFWLKGCKTVDASTAGIFTAFMPIGTLLIASIFLGETVSITQVLGMLLVLFSIYVSARA